jgi:hypothetical protein
MEKDVRNSAGQVDIHADRLLTRLVPAVARHRAVRQGKRIYAMPADDQTGRKTRGKRDKRIAVVARAVRAANEIGKHNDRQALARPMCPHIKIGKA